MSIILQDLGTCYAVEPFGFALHEPAQKQHIFEFLLDSPLLEASLPLHRAQEGIDLPSAFAGLVTTNVNRPKKHHKHQIRLCL